MPANNGVFYLLGDHLGSTNVVVDSAGNQVVEIRYTAWGETRYAPVISPTDYLYTGQREEAGLGLYYYRARWYDAALSRFAQADPVVPDLLATKAFDRYAYTYDNPIRYHDASGHTPVCGFSYSDPECPMKFTTTLAPDPSQSYCAWMPWECEVREEDNIGGNAEGYKEEYVAGPEIEHAAGIMTLQIAAADTGTYDSPSCDIPEVAAGAALVGLTEGIAATLAIVAATAASPATPAAQALVFLKTLETVNRILLPGVLAGFGMMMHACLKQSGPD